MYSGSKLSFGRAAAVATSAALLAPVASADSGDHGSLELFHLVTSFHHAGGFWLAAAIAGVAGITFYSRRNQNRQRAAVKVRSIKEK